MYVYVHAGFVWCVCVRVCVCTCVHLCVRVVNVCMRAILDHAFAYVCVCICDRCAVIIYGANVECCRVSEHTDDQNIEYGEQARIEHDRNASSVGT
jgi:hypothetical protein